mgnify:FL=1
MAMKESGIEWVGSIPDTWDVIPNKYIMHKEKNLCEKWTGEDVMSLTMNGVIVRDLQNPTGKMPATFDGYQYIEDGDLLMCLFDIDVTPRCIGKVTHNGVTSPAYSNFKTHDNASRDYYYYYYLMVDNTKELLHLAKNLRHSFTEEQLGSLKVPMPPLTEQQVIADYLNEKCSKIDNIIAEANASVEEYKELKQAVIDNATMTGIHDSEMKYTDYVWFPEMPKSWNLVLASLLFREDVRPIDANDVSLSLSQVDGLIPTDDMSERSLKSATHDNWKHVIPDDLVLNRFKGHLGVFFASKYTGMVSFHYGVYHAIRDDVYAKYYEYLFHSTTYKNIFALKSNGITVGLQNLSNGNFYSVKILHPTLDEQIEIVKYLDKRTAEIDSLIAEKESLIKDLESYKKSLIYEVVTGKRRVV